MRIKIFRAANVTSAMLRIREELGLDALILSTTSIQDGVEVTAALEIDDELELSNLLPVMPLPSFIDEPTDSHCKGQYSSYKRHNLSQELTNALVDQTSEAVFAQLFRFGDLPISPGGLPLMLVGPPGSGKTLTIAKIATRLVLNGDMPLVITTDDQRSGAVEQLAGFTRLLGLTLVVANGPETLDRALSRCQQGLPVLIDSPGFDLSEPSQTMILSELISASRACSTLILPAGIDSQEAVEIAQAHAALGTCHLLPTRLDRNGRLGGILSAAKASDLILTEAGIGTAVAMGLERLSPNVLSRRLFPTTELIAHSSMLSEQKLKTDMTIMVRSDTVSSNALSAHIAAQSSLTRSAFWKTKS